MKGFPIERARAGIHERHACLLQHCTVIALVVLVMGIHARHAYLLQHSTVIVRVVLVMRVVLERFVSPISYFVCTSGVFVSESRMAFSRALPESTTRG